MRFIVLAGLTLAMSGCISWKGDGTDEVLPDVIGMATGAKKSTGVLEQLTPREQADTNLTYNRIVEEEPGKPHPPEIAKPLGY